MVSMLNERRLDDLQEPLRRAPGVTPGLMSKFVAAGACPRIATPSCAAKAARINRLIESKAWTEAALALVELELPQWKLRRLVHEDGIWLCSLSKQWNLPVWLSDNAESRHESLPLAILSALVEAHRCADAPSRRVTGSVPQCRGESNSCVEALCCDNFA
jgi:hypothetical protein